MTGIPEATPTWDQIEALRVLMTFMRDQNTMHGLMLFGCFAALLALVVVNVARLIKK